MNQSLVSGCHPDCRACRYIRVPYPEGIEAKTGFLNKLLGPWRELLSDVRIASEKDRIGYRGKVCLAAQWTGENWNIGLRRGDDVLNLGSCPVHNDTVTRTLKVLTGVLPSYALFPLAFFVVSGAQMTLVVKAKEMPPMHWLSRDVINCMQQAGIEGIWIHLHPSAGNRVFLKREWRLFQGSPRSIAPGGLQYGPVSFQQQISGLHDGSLDRAGEHLRPGPGSLMADLYCGTGKSMKKWIAAGARVAGVELSGEACGFAAVNAPGATVFRGKCSERIPQLIKWTGDHGAGSVRLLYVNPPRTGLEENVMDWIIREYKPIRMAYLSCSPGTLSRNLTVLERSGYRVTGIIPYDFFPYAHHIECLALLERISPSFRG